MRFPPVLGTLVRAVLCVTPSRGPAGPGDPHAHGGGRRRSCEHSAWGAPGGRPCSCVLGSSGACSVISQIREVTGLIDVFPFQMSYC